MMFGVGFAFLIIGIVSLITILDLNESEDYDEGTFKCFYKFRYYNYKIMYFKGN